MDRYKRILVSVKRSGEDIRRAALIKRARTFGLSIEQIEELLGLWRYRRRTSGHVKAVALSHIDELKRKIVEMQGMADTLEHLAKHCDGDHRPDCPILDDLADKYDARRYDWWKKPHKVLGVATLTYS